MDAEPEDPRPLPWPLFTIDFEGSSLDNCTYPIEVGVCRWRSPDQPIEGWSSLIRPTAAWRNQGSWWPSSQEIHGIQLSELEQGREPTTIITTLNRIIGNNIAFCDGGPHDLRWLTRLTQESDIEPTWQLGDFDHLCLRLEQLGYMRLVRWLDRAPARHRARDDAERLIKGVARGLKLEHGTSIELKIGI